MKYTQVTRRKPGNRTTNDRQDEHRWNGKTLNELTLRCCGNYAAHLRNSTMKITLKAPNGKRQVVRGPHLERALRLQGWTDADTEEQKQRAKVKVKRNGERRAA